MKLDELVQPKNSKAVFTFGRFNPPTKGHAHLLNVVKNGAKDADHYVYTGRTQDPKRNPLSYQDKITLMRAMYPTVNIVDDPNVKNPWQALEELGKHYKEITLVVGSDRKQDFESQMRPYMKEFGIEKFTVISSGERDADATDVQGVSATKARAFARAGDFSSFSQTVDGGDNLKKELYTKVRKGMGITESKKPKNKTNPMAKQLSDPKFRPQTQIDKKAEFKKGYEKHKGKSLDTNEDPQTPKSKPIVYVDMDGVLANFFAEWAKLAGVTTGNYKDIPPAKVDPTLDKMVGTDFFNRLPKFATTDKLIQMVTTMFGSYSILSSPLRGDHENSKAQKVKWIQRELSIQPDNIIVVGRKDSYAVQKDGTPNILIDDRGRNIQGWRDRGGFGVKYQADEDPLSKVEQALTQFKSKYNLTEWGGRVVKGINTTPDVGVDAIKKQSAKLGFKVSKDGVPPIMQPKNMRSVKRMKEALIKINGANKDLTLQQQIDLLEITKGVKKIIQEKKAKRIKKAKSNQTEVPYQNDSGQLSLMTHPGTELHQKMRATAKPGTDEWFKTWRTLSYLTKGRKNHYMLPVKEQLEKLLIKHGIIKEDPEKEELIKKRVIRTLNKKRADDPMFDKIYRTIIGPALASRIENYIAAHKDTDIGTEEMAFLVKEIPRLGTTQEVKNFVLAWNKGNDFINTQELIPSEGMTAPKPLINVVDEGLPQKLFQTLTRQNFSKSDGGPGEAALAIMSPVINYTGSDTGGDVIIDKKRIEVKGGGKSAQSGGGRVINDKWKPNWAPTTAILQQAGFKGNISVVRATKEFPENFPKEEFIKATSINWFGEEIDSLINTFGTPAFALEWNKVIYNSYQAKANHQGILIIGRENYQYITSGEQLYQVKQSSKGSIYYPGSNQVRDLGIQVSIG